MIFDAILSALMGVLNALVSWLPTFTGPFTLHQGDPSTHWPDVRVVGEWLSQASRWVDVTLLIQILGFIGTALGVYGTVAVAIWVYNHIPGKAS